jgi:hypothetical protein
MSSGAELCIDLTVMKKCQCLTESTLHRALGNDTDLWHTALALEPMKEQRVSLRKRNQQRLGAGACS